MFLPSHPDYEICQAIVVNVLSADQGRLPRVAKWRGKSSDPQKTFR